MSRAFPLRPALQQIGLLQVEKGFSRKKREVLTFATKCFTGPRQTCFAASDVNPGDGVTFV